MISRSVDISRRILRYAREILAIFKTNDIPAYLVS